MAHVQNKCLQLVCIYTSLSSWYCICSGLPQIFVRVHEYTLCIAHYRHVHVHVAIYTVCYDILEEEKKGRKPRPNTSHLNNTNTKSIGHIHVHVYVQVDVQPWEQGWWVQLSPYTQASYSHTHCTCTCIYMYVPLYSLGSRPSPLHACVRRWTICGWKHHMRVDFRCTPWP